MARGLSPKSLKKVATKLQKDSNYGTIAVFLPGLAKASYALN